MNHPAYLVNLEAKSCTCLDNQESGEKCKHIWAAENVFQREFEFDDEGERAKPQPPLRVDVPRKTYRQNWPAYDRAQTNEKAKFQKLLHDLCTGIKEVPQAGPGRRRLPLPDAIFAACFKVYSTVSGRRCISDLADAKAKGYISRTPCFAKLLHVFESELTTSVLEQLVIETSSPLKAVETKFAVDSSGFSGCRFDRWFDHKWGDVRSIRAWTKAHIMVGAQPTSSLLAK